MLKGHKQRIRSIDALSLAYCSATSWRGVPRSSGYAIELKSEEGKVMNRGKDQKPERPIRYLIVTQPRKVSRRAKPSQPAGQTHRECAHPE